MLSNMMGAKNQEVDAAVDDIETMSRELLEVVQK